MQSRDPHRLVIAIDGPSGSGKSTVARGVAQVLGLRYLDTGAMYRALTWLALQRHIPLDDVEALTDLAATAVIDLATDPSAPQVRINGTDVTGPIRETDVTAAVSAVSAVPAVRAEMVRRQRSAIGNGGIVVEGRDIGTAVAPDAPVKIFLTAAQSERALRRARESGSLVDHDSIAATDAAIRRRDALDSGRAASPLTQAPDAEVVDSTTLTVDEVIALVLERARAVPAS